MAAVAREHAYTLGGIRVGSAVLAEDGNIHGGCNVEHRFRCHDVHAEVNAISTMVASGCHRMRAVVVVSDQEFFTPCGSCMDWIMQHGGADCLVGYSNVTTGLLRTFRALDLMPQYPH